MTDLLDNELVRKYFASKPDETYACCMGYTEHNRPCVAVAVIEAMQQPMKMYERALYTHDDGKTWKVGNITGVPFEEGEFHPTWLRLPDRFQQESQPLEQKRCDHKVFNIMDEIVRVCHICGAYLGLIHKPMGAPERSGICPTWNEQSGCDCPLPHLRKTTQEVESQINHILNFLCIKTTDGSWHPSLIEKEIRELVALARKP